MKDRRPFRIAVVDDERQDLDQIADYLEKMPRLQKWVEKPVSRLWAKPDASAILASIDQTFENIDIVLADLYMPTPEAGGLSLIENLARLRQSRGYGPQVVIVSSKLDAERIVENRCREHREWLRLIIKPAPLVPKPKQYHSEDIWAVGLEYAIYEIWRASRMQQPEDDCLVCFPDGKMASEVLPWADTLAKTDKPILLVGEHGTGKGLLARRIHSKSKRAKKGFEEVNCAAISDTFLESELFGHGQGALPGMTQAKRGLLETMSDGTLLIREVTEMAPYLQAKLSSLLERGQFARAGETRTRTTSARLICTVTEEPEKASGTGTLRPGLFHSLAAGKISIPALHERPEDIPRLAEHFLCKQREGGVTGAARFSAEAISRLTAYSWPGNIKELDNLVFRAVLRAREAIIGRTQLEPKLLAETDIPLEALDAKRATRFHNLTDQEIRRALEVCGNDKVRAARALGVPLASFVTELERRRIDLRWGTGIRPELYRQDETDETGPKSKCATKISFNESTVAVDGVTWKKSAPLLLAEYIILKETKVHWLWAYVILPKFDVTKRTPEQQYKNYISKTRGDLARYGIRVGFLKGEEKGYVVFEGTDGGVISNVTQIKDAYRKALSVCESNREEAVHILSVITRERNNRWHSFTDAYMALSRWICDLQFKKVPEGVIERCTEFVGWYCKRLKLGISKIDRYKAKEGLDDVSLSELEIIKSELREATALYNALVHTQPLDRDNQDFEALVDKLICARQLLESTGERFEGDERRENDSIKIMKAIAEENKDLAEVVQFGRDAWDRLLESKGQRQECSDEEIRDMHEDIYWELARVILEIPNFDACRSNKGSRLRTLRNDLCSRLHLKLTKFE